MSWVLMGGLMDGWMGGWMDELGVDGRVDRLMDGCTDNQWVGGWMRGLGNG